MISPEPIILWAGLLLGGIFGFAGQRIQFCLAGGVREMVCEKRPLRLHLFITAMATALLGTQIMAAGNLIRLETSLYMPSSTSWLLVPLGGLLFGYGMVCARGCGARALVLLGEGNLRGIVVLPALGIGAYATLTGVLAPLRLFLTEKTLWEPSGVWQSLPFLLANTGLPRWWTHLLPGLAVFLLLLFFLLPYGWRLRQTAAQLALAGLIGLCVPAAWAVTGILGADEFEPAPLESLSFVAPIGETIQFLMLATGIPAGFGVAVVCGTLGGAVISSLRSRQWELRGPDQPTELLRVLAGGIFMGIGGALALGCSIGQGLSGFSTLAFPSLIAVVAIGSGGLVALRGPLSLTLK